MASCVAVMDRGRIVQTGAPAEIYERPASRFVANFVGEVNLFEGELTAGFNCVALAVAGLNEPIPLPSGTRAGRGCCRGPGSAPGKIGAVPCASCRVCDCRDRVVDRLFGRRLDGPSRDGAAEGAQGLSAGHRGERLWPRHAGMGDLATRRGRGPDAMTGLGWTGRLVLIGVPFLWLALFFLLPLLIVVKISLAESTIGIPPYTPLLVNHGGGFELHATLANFALIAGDDLYLRAYLGSLGNAALATALCLMIGYPIAYAIARSQGVRRQLLLFLVMLPFWTSFLIRVYAWIAILEPNGLVNQCLIALGLIAAPLPLLNNQFSVELGIVYAYLPFMILPLYVPRLERMDPILREAAADLGARPWPRFLVDHVSVAIARRARRSAACVHPRGGRVRHPRPSRRSRYPDDRQSAVERVFHQS